MGSSSVRGEYIWNKLNFITLYIQELESASILIIIRSAFRIDTFVAAALVARLAGFTNRIV
jgi:hypothetical protein